MHYPSVHTKLVILLGNPLGHSYSALMHNHVFEKLKMDYCYWPVEVSAENLAAVFAGLIRMNVGGFNVTIPHKVRIMELLDEIDPFAAVIGAVNTICIKEGRTRGYNTDGEGFLKALETERDISIAGKNVFILGCGGAARAIAMTFAFHDAGKVFLCNRTISKAEQLAAEIHQKIRPCAEVIPQISAEMAPALRTCQVLVNCTCVGMHPDEASIPLDKALLFQELVVADVVYNPLMTRLLRAAQRMGCRVVDGLGMLVYQGAEAFNLWTGITPPVQEMFAVLRTGKKQT
ncbi:MAG: shikimate dehydrogenase [Candidatus Vecturithrix sp.]|jgi:shikimate dehydrogenase|nr:shikimate dehydrogenase [Candidatus Vecturithrix sp.]